MALTIDNTVVHLDATPIIVTLQAKAHPDPYSAIADLLDLQKYDGNLTVLIVWHQVETTCDGGGGNDSLLPWCRGAVVPWCRLKTKAARGGL